MFLKFCDNIYNANNSYIIGQVNKYSSNNYVYNISVSTRYTGMLFRYVLPCG